MKNLSDHLSYCTDFIGLQSLRFKLMQSDSGMFLTSEISIQDITKQNPDLLMGGLSDFFIKLEQDIRGSPSFKEYSNRVEQLEYKVKCLLDYKIHYNIEMQLRHGTKSNEHT